ncbi:MAG TPA: HD domain-containing phosphohydrolase [Anaeromyxobacteraceae bacterium]|nr:HD domain-containing phosphohydrolase [Anaeromyxobacteraceae bacterium]
MDAAALERRIAKLQSILEVAKALAAERQLDALLDLVARAAARVAEADRVSLFLLDRERGELWSKVAQGTGEIRFPMAAGVAGAAATTGRPVNVPDAYADPRFHRAVDAATGYHTRTILCVPMLDAGGGVVGVLEALNRKEGVFTGEDQELLTALGGQAAVAIENAVLHEEIERLFEGFVRASVVAIEARDPTTAGHSERVAALTVGLARAVEAAPPGPWRGVRFLPEDLRQLRYAALLHDFGKVGVREHVLVKANKLHPGDLDLIRARFDLVRATLEAERLRARLEGRPEDGILASRAELDAFWEVVAACNRPTVLPEGSFERLGEMGGRTFVDPSGTERPYLTSEELAWLSIPQGSLSDGERHEIESHVTHTFNFLSRIPWTRALRRVPDIARGHHEKLDGGGYPRGVPASAIPLETRIMTIADIFDALTASDRPYKRAVLPERALEILGAEARAGALDRDLLGVFVEAGVWHGARPRAP